MMSYVLRSGALHMYRTDGTLVVVPKLAQVVHVHTVNDPTVLGFERRKGQNLHEMQYNDEIVYMYASIQKVYPNKDDPESWFDNFWKVMLQPVV